MSNRKKSAYLFLICIFVLLIAGLFIFITTTKNQADTGISAIAEPGMEEVHSTTIEPLLLLTSYMEEPTTAPAIGGRNWLEDGQFIALQGQEISVTIDSAEQTAPFEQKLEAFFAQAGYQADPNQAADAPRGGGQRGYIHTDTAQRCLVIIEPTVDRGEDYGDYTWISATYSVFCEEM